MSAQVMRQALIAMMTISESRICDVSHHAKRDRHGMDEPCPVKLRFIDSLNALSEATRPQTSAARKGQL